MGFAPSINKESKPIYVAGIESSIEYADSQYVRKKSPKIRLLLNPFIPPLIPMEFLSQDLGGIIISCSVQKSRNQAHGTFSLSLVADEDSLDTIANLYPLSAIWGSSGKSMKDLFKPMSLGQLWMDGYHVMTGVVRVCRKQTSAGTKTYNVQFDELGVLYTQKIMTSPAVDSGIMRTSH